MDMDLKDRFDAHYKLAEYYKQVRTERRQHEWKVTLGLWLALAVATASSKSLPDIPWWLIAVFLEFVTAFHVLWSLDNFRLRDRDAGRSYIHLSMASNIAGHNEVKPPNQKLWEKYPLFEAAGTFLLCVLFGIVYSYR
jgi:hypothetical protein